MEVPEKAIEVVATAVNAAWKANIEVKSSAVIVELDDLMINRRRVVATWGHGVWATGLLFTEGRSKPRKLRNAGEVLRLLRGEL